MKKSTKNSIMAAVHVMVGIICAGEGLSERWKGHNSWAIFLFALALFNFVCYLMCCTKDGGLYD